uniref:Uncharacterized protein n=1 Tax=Arundo donax TaxID=35708 RepID=A0A0A8ZRQ7_ARUDO
MLIQATESVQYTTRF